MNVAERDQWARMMTSEDVAGRNQNWCRVKLGLCGAQSEEHYELGGCQRDRSGLVEQGWSISYLLCVQMNAFPFRMAGWGLLNLMVFITVSSVLCLLWWIPYTKLSLKKKAVVSCCNCLLYAIGLELWVAQTKPRENSSSVSYIVCFFQVLFWLTSTAIHCQTSAWRASRRRWTRSQTKCAKRSGQKTQGTPAWLPRQVLYRNVCLQSLSSALSIGTWGETAVELLQLQVLFLTLLKRSDICFNLCRGNNCLFNPRNSISPGLAVRVRLFRQKGLVN